MKGVQSGISAELVIVKNVTGCSVIVIIKVWLEITISDIRGNVEEEYILCSNL